MPTASKRKKPRMSDAELRRREAQEARRQARKRRRRAYYTIVAGTIGVLIILSFLIPELLRQSPTNRTVVPGIAVEMMEAVPIAEGVEHDPYVTTPPTSGPYYDEPAAWGIYDETLPDERVVRNLHLTGVAINHNLQDSAQIEQLKRFVQDQPSYPCYLILQPYDNIPQGTITLTAWGRMDSMDSIDEARMQRFVDYFAGNENRGLEKRSCTPEGG